MAKFCVNQAVRHKPRICNTFQSQDLDCLAPTCNGVYDSQRLLDLDCRNGVTSAVLPGNLAGI